MDKRSWCAELIVVEDILVSKLVRSVLKRKGYDAVVAGPAEAVELLRRPESTGKILLTNSPGPFLEFAESVPLLYLTSLPDPDLESAFRACRVVRKPFAPKDLIAAVDELEAAVE